MLDHTTASNTIKIETPVSMVFQEIDQSGYTQQMLRSIISISDSLLWRVKDVRELLVISLNSSTGKSVEWYSLLNERGSCDCAVLGHRTMICLIN